MVPVVMEKVIEMEYTEDEQCDTGDMDRHTYIKKQVSEVQTVNS